VDWPVEAKIWQHFTAASHRQLCAATACPPLLPASTGVSNFGLPELQQLLSLAKIPPAVVESRSDPFAINHHVIQWCLQHNVTFMGYSSLGTQWVNTPVSVNPVFNSSMLQVRRWQVF
jgi:diketogulonate reductase-like aldo/keto reductase